MASTLPVFIKLTPMVLETFKSFAIRRQVVAAGLSFKGTLMELTPSKTKTGISTGKDLATYLVTSG